MNRIRPGLWMLAVLALFMGGCGVIERVLGPASAPVAECVVTPPDMEGPYYIAGAPFRDSIYPPEIAGQRLIVSGTVYAADCQTTLAGAVVDVWQADATGEYDFSAALLGRGKVTADANGFYQFETLMPAQYGGRPPHIHIRVNHPDARELTTQIYFEGFNNGGVPAALVIPAQHDGDRLRGTFNVVLGVR